MSEFGLKIKNIKATTLFGFNQGTRAKYDYTDAMFSNSLFSNYMKKHGLSVWKEESTRDIVCLEFDFGSRSYEEEIEHLTNRLSLAKTQEEKDSIHKIMKSVEENKDKYVKMSKEEIRELFYKNGTYIDYIHRDKDGNIKSQQRIYYKMLYRSPAKAKLGQVMFINAELYDVAYEWLTMGLGKKMPQHKAKIVEMSAYAPLTTSTIVGELHIPVEDILILEDQDTFFKTMAKVVKAKEFSKSVKVLDEEATQKNKQNAIKSGKFLKNGKPKYKKVYQTEEKTSKMCIVEDEITEVKNTVWDGMGLIDESLFPSWTNGMMLLRNHFFKMCGFRTNIQKFFKDWCEKTGNDYETYQAKDMFGNYHKLKDIKVITTDNATKWKKFRDLMGENYNEAYQYWCKKINDDGSIFGIVKTDHPSKLGSVQQLSYQMVNTLPCTQKEIEELASTSVNYVELIKNDPDEFENFLRNNATEVNHYEMMADLYQHNKDFANSKWFRYEKSQIIRNYVDKLRKGKITVSGDNLTICGNPYALLLYSVGENWENDPTLCYEEGTIQCFTTRFKDGEYLCGIRNPQNAPNNISYLHNRYSEEMFKYFPFSDNIVAVNCIGSDIQSRMNGCDFDSDFMLITNEKMMVDSSKRCYDNYPTIVNDLQEGGITYDNTMEDYARMDSKLAGSRMGIGWSSNLAQLAMSYFWTEKNKDLYDNFVILSVVAQLEIDGCKKVYEVSGMDEIKRIKDMECMDRFQIVVDENGKSKKVKYDFPEFMRYTKEIKYTKNGKEISNEEIQSVKSKISGRIDPTIVCPMNWLQDILGKIKTSSKTLTIPTEDFFIKMEGKPSHFQMTKILSMIQEYDTFVLEHKDLEDAPEMILDKFNELIEALQNMKIGKPSTINRLIEKALGLNKIGRPSNGAGSEKYTRKVLNILYKMDKTKFLSNFVSENAEKTS